MSMEELTKSLEEEIEKIKKSYEKQIEELKAKLLDQEKVEKKFQRMSETIQQKESRIETLQKSIDQMQSVYNESKEKGDRLKAIEAQLAGKKSEIESKALTIKELEDRVKELEFKNANLIERYERELESTKRIYAEQAKTGKTWDLKSTARPTGTGSTSLYLHYANKNFIRVATKPVSGCLLELDQPKGRWLLDCTKESNLVERRTAERQARSIAKAGFVDGGRRVGVNYKLEIVEEGEVPEKLTRDQHKYMGG